MRSCTQCHRDVAPQVAVCPFCGERLAEAIAAEATDTQATLPVRRPRQGFTTARRSDVPRLAPVGLSASAKFWLILVVLVAGGAGAFWWLRPRHLPVATLMPTGDEAVLCQGRPTCVVVYLAPRHRASERSLQLIDELRERWEESEEVGLAVVVGADEPDALRRLADRIGGETWLDPDRRVLHATGADILPAWFVVGPDGKVLQHVEGTYFPLLYHIEKLGVTGRAI